MITALYIGDKKLDLFEDDSIIIKNSVSKIEDITKVFTETSNTFSVPATDNNNSIFKHYYNASVNNPFDARKLVLGAIYLGGLHHKTGNFKLNKVIVKSQKANSYSLDFFGLLTSLKDLVGKDKLSSLDFSAYNYPYTFANVKARLTDTATTSDVLNTLISYKRYIYDTNTATVNTDAIRNLANNNTNNNSGIVYQDTSSSIKMIKIIEAIEAKYSLTFSRDFFNTTNFSSLYMLLSGGGSLNQDTSEFLTPPSINDFDDISSVNFSVNVRDQQPFGMAIYKNGVLILKRENLTGVKNILIDYNPFDSSFDVLTYEIFSSVIINFSSTITITGTDVNGQTITRDTSRSLGLISSNFIVSEKMPDIEIINFLKGIFQMFKLIVVPTSATNLFVDSYSNYYSSGANRDITKFIDFSKSDINSGEFINEINYKFEEAQTLLAEQFRILTTIDYGNLELKIIGDNGKIIEGNSVNIELPFENMVYEKLSDVSDAEVSNVVYGLLQDKNQEPAEIEPHIHYISTLALVNSIKILNESGNSELITGNFCTPSHKNSTSSTTFGEEIDEQTNALITNTLYLNYHKAFIESSFNVKRKLYNYKAKNVPLDLINNIRLNDNIVIKGRAYRIDSYNTNITTKEIDFNLINIT